ncbi:DUF1680 superfamily domain-containing protein [Histoplasma capsulatum]|uniref:DUF1680 superfamily domain-containing protein n=1 Tax=Ajellomyces capsulatus TaxID=5037 RepID=A0A8A1MLD9_AJECA|nr:DUF1680 superfamily domain-containing protein [Histoplasma capsulatum]
MDDNHKSLLPFVFKALPLGAVKPQGWLRDQLTLMANGLAGHELDFYRVVRDSRWLGGTQDYSDLNEAMPYWFNGLVPLAYLTQDKRLLEQVRKVANYVLTHQQEDGWLGPETVVSERNFWARTPMFLGLAQMVEAQPGDAEVERILNAMHKYVNLMHSMLSNNLQGLVWHHGDNFNEQWGRSRAADMILALQWLYETDPRDNADKIKEGTTGLGGYPKFVSAMFVRKGEDGIGQALLGPAEVRTTTSSGTKVNINCETAYPFDNALSYKIDAGGPFTLSFRVPSWADNAKSLVSVDSAGGTSLKPSPATGMHDVSITQGKHVVTVSFATEIRVEKRARNTVAVYYGALLYAVPIDARVTYVKSNYPGAPDSAREYTMTPSSKWALAIDPSTLRFNALAARGDDGAATPNNENQLPNPLWAEKATSTSISARACEIKWELTEPKGEGYAPDPPRESERECIGKPFEVKLMPYGSARLHMAELPTVKLA